MIKINLKKLFSLIDYIYTHPVNKNRFFSTTLKLLYWQFYLKNIRKSFTIPFINNLKINSFRGNHCVSGTYYVGLYDFEKMSFLLHYLRPDDIFCDVGANIGLFTMLASGINNCKSICFEPNPTTFSKLKDNININRLDKKVRLFCKGVGAKSEYVNFTKDLDTTAHVATEDMDSKHSVKTELISLEKFFSKQKIPELIKIDVEGYEYQVIQGGMSILDSNQSPNVIICELRGIGKRYNYDENWIDVYLRSVGYKSYVYCVMKRKLGEKPYNSSSYIGDMLYIKNFEKAQERVKNGCVFKVNDLSI